MSAFSRHKRSIVRLAEKLNHLKKNPEDLSALVDLQLDIVRLIRRAEARIAELKLKRSNLNSEKRRSRLHKPQAQAIKEKISQTSKQIEDAQHLAYIWRSFGDGIAYIYLDKYALKHMLYNSHNYSVKQTAGAISNKKGFKHEWKLVLTLIKSNVPTMLCDISNTLRHGDVCILLGPDPFPIEVKSSNNTNAQVARQHDALSSLHRFLAEDEAKDFRGLPHIKRVEFPHPDVNHAHQMVKCIERSRSCEFSFISPEEGLTYASLRGKPHEDVIAPHVAPNRTMATFLNTLKVTQTWMPYYPFTLSIDDPQALYEFINGDVILVVLLDTEALTRHFGAKGLEIFLMDHPDWAMAVRRRSPNSNGAVACISNPFFCRIFYEFESLESLAELELKHLEYQERLMLEEHPSDTPDETSTSHYEIVDWSSILPSDWVMAMRNPR